MPALNWDWVTKLEVGTDADARLLNAAEFNSADLTFKEFVVWSDVASDELLRKRGDSLRCCGCCLRIGNDERGAGMQDRALREIVRCKDVADRDAERLRDAAQRVPCLHGVGYEVVCGLLRGFDAGRRCGGDGLRGWDGGRVVRERLVQAE